MGYIPITLPNSKEVVLIQPISPFLFDKLRRQYPPPHPPVQRVNLGTADSPHWEETPNDADPDYIVAREQWTRDLEQRIRRFTINVGAKIEWDDSKKECLAELRESIRKTNEELEMDVVIEGDDSFAYINYIACQNMEDYKYLLKCIMEGSRPTEGAIQDAVATFQSHANGHSTDLQGQEHI